MGKNNQHRQSKVKQQSFSIRKFNGKVLSLAIGTTFLLSLPLGKTIQASEESINLDSLSDVAVSQTVDPAEVSVEAVDHEASMVQEEPAIEEGHFRIHVPKEVVNEDQPDDTKLWLWGGVKEPSGENGKPQWPNGEALAKERQTNYGYYYDVPQSKTAEDINFLVIQQGKKITQADQKIPLTIPKMNEVYLDKDFNQHYYAPLQDENLLKINYYREDGNYQNYRLWIWGDVESKSEDVSHWPHGQVFDLDPKYGGSSLVRLSKGLQSNLSLKYDVS